MKKRLKKLKSWIKKKSFKGLFMRLIVAFCIIYIVRITERSLHICETMQVSPAAVYGTAVGFFGAELVMLLVKRIMVKNSDNYDSSSKKAGNKIKNGNPLPLDGSDEL